MAPRTPRSRKVAVVTGAARRLGRHIAHGLAERKFDVVITYRHSAADARRTVGELKALGSRSRAVRVDVSRSADVRRLFAVLRKEYGRLDVAIGNAGIYPDAVALPDVSEALYDEIMDTNCKGNFLFGQAAARMMHASGRPGRIVFLASLGGMQIWRDRLPYNVSKSALITLTKAMARATASQSITVNAVAPGFIEMEDEPGAMPTFGEQRVPVQRFGRPEDIVEAVMFFVESGGYVTGQILAVDGGITTIG